MCGVVPDEFVASALIVLHAHPVTVNMLLMGIIMAIEYGRRLITPGAQNFTPTPTPTPTLKILYIVFVAPILVQFRDGNSIRQNKRAFAYCATCQSDNTIDVIVIVA